SPAASTLCGVKPCDAGRRRELLVERATPRPESRPLVPLPRRPHIWTMADMLLKPDPEDSRLTRRVRGIDQDGAAIDTAVVVERPLTLFLNGQEVVTMMTIGDFPDYLAVGYLLNQNMLRPDDEIIAIDHDAELDVVVVRTKRQTDFEDKLKKKTL